MDRRRFLGISAVTTAAVMTGTINRIAKSEFSRAEFSDRGISNRRMFGGCGDSRMMNDSFPGFLEREILDIRA